MIELIRSEFKGEEDQFERRLSSGTGNQYQQAFRFLHARRGQDAANRVVRTAVWKALNEDNWPSHLPPTSAKQADSAICRALEEHIDAWILPQAVDSFGQLLVSCADIFGGAVLTTNFDPLIGVSVQKHGGRHYRTVLHDDGRLGQTYSPGTHIVYLHGYWQGADTLHTPQQLAQPRPQLGNSLAHVVKTSTLVVVGYGGWDDVITRTLVGLLSDSVSNPDIMWAFHKPNVREVEASNEQLLTMLGPGIGRGRVSLYHGVDCGTLFRQIHSRLKANYSDGSSLGSSAQLTTSVKEGYSRITKSRELRIEIGVPMPPQITADSDRPLFVEPWVGRVQELDILASLNVPVAFITGLGGQGKSALAGRYLMEEAIKSESRFEFWDWRDCREESDRLITQILRLIERLSCGAVEASRIEVSDIEAVVGVLFHVLRDRRALLVFDNVDQYVDLETLRPVKILDSLISGAQARSHQSLLVFTCRPDVRVDKSRAMRLSLDGLSENEVAQLLTARGVKSGESHLANEVHRTTEGHPLWVNLIAMQAVRHPGGLTGVLDLVRRGGATLPDTTRTIWGMLNDQQRNVLRTMAELDRPEPERRLIDLLPGLNVNRVNRALRTLRSFHLIETRTQTEGEPVLGLHPIIREFVRTNFPKRDREKYIGTILSFLDRMIGRYKGLLWQDPSYEIMEHWMRKAEIYTTFGRFEEAISTISEVAEPLINRGFSEAMIRHTVRLFDQIDWAEACTSYKAFDDIFEKCLTAMIQLGHDSTEKFLTKYEISIPGRSSQFILLCDLRCYHDWYVGQLDSAIRWGEKGSELKQATSVDTRFSTRHNLALARRDAGRITEALDAFLEDELLESVVTSGESISDKEAPFYGNIGRCLYLLDRIEESLVCYVKCAQLLEGDHTRVARLNRGYIRYWLGQLLEKGGKSGLAAAAYRAAVCMWEDSSPPRGREAREKLQTLVEGNIELQRYLDMEEWRAEEEFTYWLGRQ